MPAYYSSRLNESTYIVVHRDKLSEYPYIYVKLYHEPSLVVVFDTGCGADSTHNEDEAQDLKDFIQTDLLSAAYETSGDPGNGIRESDWMVICTHCHFDHIGGIQSFADAGAAILASGYDRDFVSPEHRAANSLCSAFGIETPHFEISHFAGDGERIHYDGHNLGLQALHTPGHTPDSLAIFDEVEKWLFVGDTFYRCVAEMPWGEEQGVPIVFPLQGDWKAWCASMQKLSDFVEEKNAEHDSPVRIACGHTTSNALATELLRKVIDFGKGVADGSVPLVMEVPGNEVAPGGSLGDEIFFLWKQAFEQPPLSMIAPQRFKRDFCE